MKHACKLAGRAAWLLRWALGWAGAFSCGRAAAQVSESPGSALRVVVRVCSERDAQALQRLRGQTSDLPVSLLAQPNDVLEASFEQRMARAEQLATEQHSAAVVWFDLSRVEAQDAALIVYVATPSDGRVLVRRVESATAGAEQAGALSDSGAPRTSSAALEQAALVVRFALQGLAQGGSIGVDGGSVIVSNSGKAPALRGGVSSNSGNAPALRGGASPSAPTQAPEPVPTPSKPAAEPSAAATNDGASLISEPSEQAYARNVWLALGYELAVDGFAPAAEHGLRAQLSWQGTAWETGAFVGAALPAEREASPAGMRLQRVRIGAGLAARWPLGPHWSLSAGGQGGALLQHRDTLADDHSATPRQARWNAALALGPEASVRARSQGFGLQLGVGLDWIPSPTRFAVRDGGQDVAAEQPSALQPRVFLAGELAP